VVAGQRRNSFSDEAQKCRFEFHADALHLVRLRSLDRLAMTAARAMPSCCNHREITHMAMTMTGEVLLPASRTVVWAKLNDPDVLKACIPGCEELVMDDPTHFMAVAKIKLGPVKATFRGRVELQDLDPPNSYKIAGEGDGGIAGFAKGGATVALTDGPDGGTLLSYDVEAQIGGKLMQLGSRLIDSVAKKYADEFFTQFAVEVGGSAR
jgi:uncharacterized protein